MCLGAITVEEGGRIDLRGRGGGGGHGAAGADGGRCGADGRNYNVFDTNSGAPLPIANPPARFSSGGDEHGGAELDPMPLGSGGGAGGNNYDGNGRGGDGGAGRIRIDAGEQVGDGAIEPEAGFLGDGVAPPDEDGDGIPDACQERP